MARLLSGETLTFEVEHYHKDGHVFPMEVSASLIRSDAESYIQCFHRDITERKRVEEALKESEFFFKESQRSASIGSYKFDFNSGYWESSEVLDNIFGIDRNYNRTAQGWLDIVHPDDREKMDRYLREEVISRRMPFSKEYRIIRNIDGETRWVKGLGKITQDHNSNTSSLIGTIHDITERKETDEERRRLEQQFQHAQKLESLGVLAGGIAHDFNNILTVILGQCFMARQDTDPDKSYKQHFQQIETAANRAADLCRQMLTYAGRTEFEQTSLSMKQLVDDAVKMLQSAIKKNVTIELDLKRDVPKIKGDIGQIQQIVMNLIINAVEAIGDDNGTVKVVLSKTVYKADKKETDTFGTVIRAGTYACLEVSDTGIGMDAETQRRIFEPFYTTKFTGRGLGMSAISGIVKSHDAALKLTSTPGVGTTFRVYFHATEADDEVENAPAESTQSKQAGGTILLVDDEQMLLNMGEVLLGMLGFSVITAENGREAVEIYRERGAEIDVILLDLIMPVMGGIEAYHELRKISSAIPIVICSGYSIESVIGTIADDEHAGFMNKPYKPDSLRDVILKMK
jgi:PAS domain S-box-containing protein